MPKNILKLITGVAGIFLLSRLLGFVREMIIAHKFGTSADYDLYLIAIMLPALAYGVINFSTVYLFVPFLSKKKSAENNDICWSDIWPSFNLVIGTSFVLSLLIVFGAPYVMKIWASDYTPENFEQIVWYSRITSLMLFVGTTEAFMRAYLNVKKIFVYPAGGYIIYNLFSIASILLLYQQLSTGAIIVGLLGGLVAQNIFLLLKILPFKPFSKFSLTFYNDETASIFKIGLFIILIEIINRSYFLIDRYVALEFGEGIISALNYSQVLVQLPESIIGFAIGSVVFPFFSENSNKKDDLNFFSIYSSTIISSIVLSVVIAVFFFANAHDLVNLLFSRGVFNEQSVNITAATLRPFTISIVALFVITASMRAIYSRGWSKQLLGLTLFVFILKVSGNFILPKFIGYPGISLSTGLSHLAFAIGMVIMIVTKIEIQDKLALFKQSLKIIAVGLLLAFGSFYLSAWLTQLISGADKLSVIYRILISGIILLPVYALLMYLLGMKKVLSSLLRSKVPYGQ